jgi:VNT family MFS transporter (synaptic vesicle glycoprotein 2)
MVGRLLCGAFAWMIIPVGSIHGSLGSIQFHSWRLFIAVSALPSILGALLYFILPESPRYLLEVGKERKAVKILERVYKINHLFRRNVPEFPVSLSVPCTCTYLVVNEPYVIQIS